MKFLKLFLILIGFFIFSYSNAETVNEIAIIVNGEIITTAELNKSINYMQSYLAQSKQDLLSQEEIKKETINQLIDEKIILQEAKKKDIKINENELNDAFEEIKKKYSSEEEFNSSLQKQNLTCEEFKKQLKDYILREKVIQQEVISSIQEKMNESNMQKYYENNKAIFKAPDIVSVRKLFIPHQITEEDKKAIQDKLNFIIQLFKKGKPFEDLVKEYSDDISTKDKGGDLGFFGKGEMVESFEKAAFNLKIGKISDIVETPYGFHLIKLIDKKDDKIKVSHLLFKRQISEKSKTETFKKLEKILSELKTNEDFVMLIEKYGDKSGNEYLENMPLNNFSEEIKNEISKLNKGEISKIIEDINFAINGLSVYQLEDKKEGEYYSLDNVKEYIQRAILTEEIKNWVNKKREESDVEIKTKF